MNHITEITSENSISNQDIVNSIEDNLTIVNSNPIKYQSGLNLFSLLEGQPGEKTNITNSHLLLTDMEGNVVKLIASEEGRGFNNPKMINETTIMTSSSFLITFWNIYTDQKEIFTIGRDMHHDIVYNEISQTFLALEYNLVSINGQFMFTDRIVEYNRDGEILWEWFLHDHVESDWYFEYSPSLENHTRGFANIQYEDPTHSNALFWDFESDKIYLNIRHYNQFYQIDHKTGQVDWYAGQNGNFTMYKSDGSESQSLWYHSHDLNPIGNNEFTMFDNGLHNVTNPNYELSSVLKVKIDDSNWVINETYRWQAPSNYYSSFWGGSRVLNNGNIFGIFGATKHTNNTEFGGVAIEIDNEGEVVWEMRTPYGWGFYRMLRINPTEPIPTNLDSSETSNNDESVFWFQPGMILICFVIVKYLKK